jgi:hypothetical protein
MRLRLWIGIPIAALVMIYAVATALPTPECGEGGGASSLEMSLFTIFVALCGIACLGGAAASLFPGWRRSYFGSRLASRVLLTVFLPLYLLAAALSYLVIFVLALIGQSGLAC